MLQIGGGLTVFGIAALAEDSFDPEKFDVTPLDQLEEVEVEADGLEYFTIQQARVVHDLTARIYPSDDNGPGAPEAGVVYFIDRQLNSAWGHGEHWYMEGPFAGKDPTPPFQPDEEEPADEDDDSPVPWAETTPAQTQGWQYPLAPNEAYDQGIAAIEDYVGAEYDADSFTGLDGNQQDEVVSALQDNDLGTFDDLAIDGTGFFLLVRQNTMEGMFCDPMWGGNREMIGWRLKGFPGTPGALGSYRGALQEGEYIELEEGDFRKLADDVASLDLGDDNEEPAGEHGGGHPNVQPLEELEASEASHGDHGHSHAKEAAEADYPKIVDPEAARGDADGVSDDGGDS